MSWDSFVWFALTAVLLWAAGAFFAWKERKPLVYACTLTGIALFFAFILGMWISLERPPLRTMGETRLWYSFFLPVAGIIVYSRWRYKWILSFSTLLSFVFICVNLLKPGIHSKSLMPALQSPWFAPHVIVYMFSYALLGAATVMAVYMLIRKGEDHGEGDQPYGQSGLCGPGLLDIRDALRRAMGQRGLGNLLGLGSQRNLGCRHVALLSGVHAPAQGQAR